MECMVCGLGVMLASMDLSGKSSGNTVGNLVLQPSNVAAGIPVGVVWLRS